MKKRFLICLVLTLSILLGCGTQPIKKELLEAMARFDQVYIPAFYFTGVQKQRGAEIAMERLRPEWENFNTKYFGLEIKYGVNITDKFWKEDFRKMQTLIASAEDSIKTAKLAEAHQNLEEIRKIMEEIRHRNGMPYALDNLMVLEKPLANIADLLPRIKEKFSDKDYSRLSGLSQQAQEMWKKVMLTKVEAALFGFEPAKRAALEERIKQEQKNLLQIDGALYSRDRAQISAAVEQAEAEFMQIYRAFGDFKPILEKIKDEEKELIRAEEKAKPAKSISNKKISKKKEARQKRRAK